MAVPDEVNFALDPNFAMLVPYRTQAWPGQLLGFDLRVTNHSSKPGSAAG